MLKPAKGSRRAAKRVGRGDGSGLGRTAGRGDKGALARSGSKRKLALEGGQMPVHMRLRKLRGPHMKKSMPFEQFRTHTQPVNVGQLDRLFSDGETVTPQRLREHGLCRTKTVAIKVLASGELSKKLNVEAHAFSGSARSKIEAAGGTCTLLGS